MNPRHTEADLRKALELNPQDCGSRIGLGALYEDQNKLIEAAAEFERAIAIDPKHGGSYCQLGRIYRKQGRLPEAEAALRKALELDPESGWVRFELGVFCQGEDRLAEAAAEFEKAIALDGNNSWAHCHLGRIYCRQGRLPEAEAALRKALELDPQECGTRIELGSIYEGQNKLIEAEAEFQKALAIAPRNVGACLCLGEFHLRWCQWAEAEAAFQRAAAMGPGDRRACLGMCAVYRGQGRWPEAEAALKKALELDPESGWARFELGVFYQGEDRLAEAAAEFEKAVAIDPHNVGSRLHLGHIHLRLGQWAEAEAEFRSAATLDARNDGAYIGLWAVCRGQGRAAEAAAALVQALALNPRSASASAGLLDSVDQERAMGEMAARAGPGIGVNVSGAPGRCGLAGMYGILPPNLARDGSIAVMRERVFCLLPWTHLHVRADGSFHPCCAWNGPPLGNARSASIEELWNAPGMKALRSDMMRGRPVAGCWRCYENERSGFLSPRQDNNIGFSRHQGRERLTAPDGTLPQSSVLSLDLRLSNACNLRCRTCDPIQSSAWAADARALGLPAGGRPIQKSYDDWDSFWRQLRPVLEGGIEVINFAGGEPLVMEEHYRILDFLIARGLTDVRLAYNTNFSTLRFQGQDVIDRWLCFRKVDVAASLDGSGRRGEYLRKGLRWDAVVANREEMLRRCPGVSFSILATLSIFNALHLPDFHREWVEKGYLERNALVFCMLVTPAIYRMQVLPAALKERVLESYQRHRESFLDADGPAARGFAAAASLIEGQDLSELLPGFVAMTRSLDRLRGEDCREVFPELAGLFEAAA